MPLLQPHVRTIHSSRGIRFYFPNPAASTRPAFSRHNPDAKMKKKDLVDCLSLFSLSFSRCVCYLAGSLPSLFKKQKKVFHSVSRSVGRSLLPLFLSFSLVCPKLPKSINDCYVMTSVDVDHTQTVALHSTYFSLFESESSEKIICLSLLVVSSLSLFLSLLSLSIFLC